MNLGDNADRSLTVGIMIRDKEILRCLTELAERTGQSRSALLKDALLEMEESVSKSNIEHPVFARERVIYRTYSL